MKVFEVEQTPYKFSSERIVADSHEEAVVRYAQRHDPKLARRGRMDFSARFDRKQAEELSVADTISPSLDTDSDELLDTETYIDGELTLYHLYDLADNTQIASFICRKVEDL